MKFGLLLFPFLHLPALTLSATQYPRSDAYQYRRFFPVETLMEIFLNALSSEWVHRRDACWNRAPSSRWQRQYYREPTGGFYPPRFSTIVSRVCAHWRRLALNQPILWTYIKFGPKLRTMERSGVKLFNPKRVETWVQRSNSSPLHIRIHDFYGKEFDIDSLLHMLQPTVHRWKTLEIDGFLLNKITHVLAHYPSATNLRSLSIRESGRDIRL